MGFKSGLLRVQFLHQQTQQKKQHAVQDLLLYTFLLLNSFDQRPLVLYGPPN